MKRKFLPLFLAGLITIISSCTGDDIDNLQSQIDDLNTKVEDLEGTQQEALLAEIAKLQETIAALQADVDSGSSNYEALLSSLQLLEDEVASNVAAVYYGNLLTDADFSAFAAQGATIVTGKVTATSDTHISALSTLKMVGGTLTVEGGSSIELANLQNVSGALYIKDLDTEGAMVKLPVLASVGDVVVIESNSALTSVMADALVLINGGFISMGNPLLETLSFAALDQVQSVYVDEYNSNDPNYIYLGSLTALELSSANVLGDVAIRYVSGGSLKLGNIGGDFYMEYTNITDLVIGSETIMGDFYMQYSGNLTNVDFSSITTIEGDIMIGYNSTDWYDWESPVGIESLPSFESLETIGGNVTIEGNGKLTSLDGFHNVTTFSGSLIKFSNNGGSGSGLAYISVFNGLEDGGPNAYSKMDINVWENTSWFDGFNALLGANDITLSVAGLLDENWANGPTKIEGFEAMTACKSLQLNAKNAESFSAFSALDNFSGWGTTNCLVLEMPTDINVGMCSMEGIFTKIQNGDFDSKPAIFNFNYNSVETVSAIAQLLAPCAN